MEKSWHGLAFHGAMVQQFGGWFCPKNMVHFWVRFL